MRPRPHAGGSAGACGTRQELRGNRGERWPKAGPIGIPFVALPTPAGTGTEVSPVAVVLNEDLGVKTNVLSAFIVADVAIPDGDMAVLQPEGCIRIVDRVKDIDIAGGEHLGSAEVGDVLGRASQRPQTQADPGDIPALACRPVTAFTAPKMLRIRTNFRRPAPARAEVRDPPPAQAGGGEG